MRRHEEGDQPPEADRDFWEKIAGPLIAVSVVIIALTFLMPWLIDYRIKSKVAQARKDQRLIATALESYFVDVSYYPAWARGNSGANSLASPDDAAYDFPTFRIHTLSKGNPRWDEERFMSLTTPVAYLTHYFPDPFATRRGSTYGYYTRNFGYIVPVVKHHKFNNINASRKHFA